MRKSILQELYPDTVKFQKLNACDVPLSYTNMEEEYDTLRHKIGIIDGIGYSILKLEGEKAVNLLDDLATRDIRYLNTGKISECLFLDEEAEALGITYIIKNEESFLVLVPPENGEKITKWIKEKNEYQVSITDFTEQNSLIFLEGEKSWKIVKELFAFSVETLPLRDMTKISFAGDSLMLARIGRSGEYGYAILGLHHTVAEVVKECLKRYENEGLKFCGTEALNLCMMEITQPQIHAEITREGNVFELAQQWMIQFDKEDYCGHDCLMEQFKKGIEKKSVGFLIAGCKALSGQPPIFLEDEEIGKVLYGKYDPTLKGILGIALINDQVAVSGITLSVEINEEKFSIKTLSSPFVRPLSWDSQIE